MANYLAMDTGGSKVLAVLYGDDFRPRAISRVGSFRSNTTSAELIAHNIEQMMQELGLVPGMVIDRIVGIVYTEFLDVLEKRCVIKGIDNIGELQAGLHAAGIYGDGMMTLSGTGSNVGAFLQGTTYYAGGYGASVSDAGSGYWMAREAMNAAIADFDGYGEKTLLTELIAGYFGYPADQLNRAIFSIYDNTDLSPVAQVASCAPLVSKAAAAGDEIARDILKRTGEILGKQAVAMIRKNHFPDDLPMTISGSVWRSDRILFDAFADCLHAQSPGRPIMLPEFEPILGVMIWHHLHMYGRFDEEDRAKFRALYPTYTFNLNL